MSDPKSEPAGNGAQPDSTKGTEPTDAPTTDTDSAAEDKPTTDDTSTFADDKPAAQEASAAEDTVAANVDAPAQTPAPTEPVAGGSEETAAADSEQPTVGDAERPTAADSVAANADAPAEASEKGPAGDTTDAIPVQDGSDATKEMPPQPDKDGTADTPAGDTNGAATGATGEAPAQAKKRRNPWPTVGTLVAVLVILAAIGYFGGLGPLNRLSTTRDLHPPDQVTGLDRITDPAIRQQYQLDATRDALRRINNGKKATVEAYGKVPDRLFMVIALRGKVNIDKEIRDSGATGDQVKEVGKSTCAASVQDIPTSCYRGSNTLTVIAQGLGNMNDVNAIGAVADEAFEAMK